MPRDYPVRIDNGIAKFIEDYIARHEELGFNSVREFVEDVIRDKIMEIQRKEEKDKKE